MSAQALTNTAGNRDTFTRRKQHANKATQPDDGICTFFIRGHCKFGDGCRLIHQSPEATDADAQVSLRILLLKYGFIQFVSVGSLRPALHVVLEAPKLR
jgi:hypothetical protein